MYIYIFFEEHRSLHKKFIHTRTQCFVPKHSSASDHIKKREGGGWHGLHICMGLRIIIGLKTMNDDGQLKLVSGMRVRVGSDLKKITNF